MQNEKPKICIVHDSTDLTLISEIELFENELIIHNFAILKPPTIEEILKKPKEFFKSIDLLIVECTKRTEDIEKLLIHAKRGEFPTIVASMDFDIIPLHLRQDEEEKKLPKIFFLKDYEVIWRDLLKQTKIAVQMIIDSEPKPGEKRRKVIYDFEIPNKQETYESN